jgi:hypothetical protein
VNAIMKLFGSVQFLCYQSPISFSTSSLLHGVSWRDEPRDRFKTTSDYFHGKFTVGVTPSNIYSTACIGLCINVLHRVICLGPFILSGVSLLSYFHRPILVSLYQNVLMDIWEEFHYKIYGDTEDVHFVKVT